MASLSLYVISNQFATFTDFQVGAKFCFLCVKRKISKCARVFFVQYTSGVSTNEAKWLGFHALSIDCVFCELVLPLQFFLQRLRLWVYKLKLTYKEPLKVEED